MHEPRDQPHATCTLSGPGSSQQRVRQGCLLRPQHAWHGQGKSPCQNHPPGSRLGTPCGHSPAWASHLLQFAASRCSKAARAQDAAARRLGCAYACTRARTGREPSALPQTCPLPSLGLQPCNNRTSRPRACSRKPCRLAQCDQYACFGTSCLHPAPSQDGVQSTVCALGSASAARTPVRTGQLD